MGGGHSKSHVSFRHKRPIWSFLVYEIRRFSIQKIIEQFLNFNQLEEANISLLKLVNRVEEISVSLVEIERLNSIFNNSKRYIYILRICSYEVHTKRCTSNSSPMNLMVRCCMGDFRARKNISLKCQNLLL